MSKQAKLNLFELNWDIEVSTTSTTDYGGFASASVNPCTQAGCPQTQMTQCC
ncbi:MAG: hypothetical protein WDW20_04380 [Neisseriaceae bacterium]